MYVADLLSLLPDAARCWSLRSLLSNPSLNCWSLSHYLLITVANLRYCWSCQSPYSPLLLVVNANIAACWYCRSLTLVTFAVHCRPRWTQSVSRCCRWLLSPIVAVADSCSPVAVVKTDHCWLFSRHLLAAAVTSHCCQLLLVAELVTSCCWYQSINTFIWI